MLSYRPQNAICSAATCVTTAKVTACKQISGRSVSGRKAAIVDDTCSAGRSLLRCAETVKQHGGDVVQVIALFDRDAGGMAVKAAGYRYDYALRVSEDGSCEPQLE